MIVLRPEQAIPPTLLPMYENMGYWAQCKMNGAYTQVTVRDGKVVDTRNRHDQQHKAWKLTPASARVWQLAGEGESQFVAELMHSKVPGLRDTHYIHDVVKFRGEDVSRKCYGERWKILSDVFGTSIIDQHPTHFVIDEHAWLARCFKPGDGYKAMFDSMIASEHEGLVLKHPTYPANMAAWTTKCRRPNKNLSF